MFGSGCLVWALLLDLTFKLFKVNGIELELVVRQIVLQRVKILLWSHLIYGFKLID